MRVLVLGGSTEASELSPLLAADGRFDAILSLAGRTLNPRAQAVPLRSGGFGGVDGLKAWLREHGTEAVIDATHPFAAQMSAHAVAACAQLGIPLTSIDRPAWQPVPGDDWRSVDSVTDAVGALGAAPRRVLLTVGRLELSAFAAAPQHHYVARMVDPPGDIALPPDLHVRLARGPFDLASEAALLDDEQVEVIVSKNSGGGAAYAKIVAARERGIPVVMIARPHKPRGDWLASPAAAIPWLEQRLHHSLSRSARGV
ncbi:cobalt-precorrin-6A reductase [Rhodopseudomonas sp. P2A-2r]|uniref:cobalt-precorrin-6A reductase n=1 Tax=unclassified Rhodopseudomonas TaxID=2638247 RepID=UPI0022345E94|nr:cobalt-precorrin-6A reductase [Rhodopseudomonas sp. P2A-2r]UZE47536.1 cobalt-precorrin-6A reductase [Rhodopseudomonas sp. P2A-2r]